MKYLVFIITVLTTLLFFIIYTSLAENLNLNDFGRLWIVILIILSLFLMFKKINKNNNSKKPVKNTINESNESLDERKDSIKARRKAQEEEEEEEQKRAHLKGLLKPNQERLEKEKAEKKKRDQILAAAAAAALALRLKKPEVFAPQGYRITDMKLTNKFFIEWTIYYIDESKPNEKKYFKASIGSKGINTGGTLFKFKWASPI